MLTVHVLVVVWTVETINSRDVNIIVCSGTIIEALLHSYLFWSVLSLQFHRPFRPVKFILTLGFNVD